MKLKQTSDKILELLTTLTGTNKPLTGVKDYHTLEGNYPYATFELVNMDTEPLDNCQSIRILQFDILVFQSILEDDSNRQEAKDNVYLILDDIFELFDENYTLDGLADAGTEVLGGSLTPFITQSGKALVGKLELKARITYNRK